MKQKKIHTHLCIILWSLWFCAILITVLYTILSSMNDFDVNCFFWKIVEPYNRTILLLSLIPIEPIICVFTIIKKCEPVKKTIVFFLITMVLWATNIIIYVSLIGGV